MDKPYSTSPLWFVTKYISCVLQNIYLVCAPFMQQTTQDSIPEIARQYTLRLVSAGEATINTSISQLTVIMASSDNPHGIVNFLPPLTRTVSEDTASATVTILRSGGTVGDLAVNITVHDSGATMPSDYKVSNNSECVNCQMQFTVYFCLCMCY